ncbi:MAG: DNA polymerase III subunit beta, partial [Actinomycetota bacterium]|nr:DNA polymerase III subunit beta [Actinomycetota bacterium]
MKLTAPRESFVTALGHAGRAVSSRSTLPSLGGILFNATSEGLQLRATDMEMGISLTLEAQVEREGTVLLPGRLLADVARSLPQGDVTLELRSEQRDVELTAGDARFHFRTLPAEDFPRLPDVEGDA